MEVRLNLEEEEQQPAEYPTRINLTKEAYKRLSSAVANKLAWMDVGTQFPRN
jgi:hypothetical protein